MNILFITADQWRGECLSALGHAHVKTPNLDALAADGVTFAQHFAQATPCGPSRACLYTGMYLQNHRSILNGTPLDARHTNLAQEARKAGYEPALFGYTDVSLDPRKFAVGGRIPGGYEGVLPGMDPVCLLTGEWQPWQDDLREKGYQLSGDLWDIFKPQSPCPGANDKGKTFAPARFKAQDSSAAFLADRVIDYLSQPGRAPWFVHLSLYAPHPPFIAPAPYNAMYDAGDMPLPTRRKTAQIEAAQHPWLGHYLFNQRGKYWTYGEDSRDNLAISNLDLRQIRATYYAMMSDLDAQIGRLIDHLKQQGSYDDTLIIFTSDHGEQLGDHWMFAKYGYFDQSFSIPLIIRDPTAVATPARGAIIDDFTESIDLMPTILQAIGQDIPAQCDGASLLPFCRGGQPAGWRQQYHAEFDLRSPYGIDEAIPLGLNAKNCGVGIIADARYKYVHFTALPPLFFDRQSDPDEFEDRSRDPAYRAQMLDYAGKMLSWRMKHDDPALTGLYLSDDGTVEVLEPS